MSLKAFHVVFITAATLFVAGCGVLILRQYLHTGGGELLLLAVLSFAGAVALPIYGVWFLKKMKHVSYV